MNGAATVSPLSVPNRCKCGHDYTAHNLTTSPNTCALCTTTNAASPNKHDFTSVNEVWPSNPFPQDLPQRFVSSGASGIQFTRKTSGANIPGQNLINFAAGSPPILPGMTFTCTPNAQTQVSYRIVDYNATTNQATIAPALIASISGGTNCIFNGLMGSTMGPGLPPNGQRAG